jgi:hypothetical protein
MKNAGMSYSSQNKNVNGGPTKGGGSPKDIKAGADTGMHSTNTISTPGCNPPEGSPSATKHSKNQYGSKSKY